MKFAVDVPPFGTFGDPQVLADLAAAADRAGWDGFFVWDHIMYSEPVPFADPWISLAAMATTTERIRLGPLVTPLPRRRPWKLARESVTLDHLSGGRLVLGVGLGIDFWREYSAFTGEAADDVERALLLDEGLEIVTRLWSGEAATWAGERLSVQGARFLPRPVQQPRIPVWTAALWPLRPGPARRASRWDGVVPFGVAGRLTPDDVGTLVREVTRHRDDDLPPPDVCVEAPLERADDYEEAGATWLLRAFGPHEPLDEVRGIVESGPRP